MIRYRLVVIAALLALTLITPASAGSLDDINDTFAIETGGWLNGALNVADGLFGFLMTLFIVYKLAAAGVDSIGGRQDFGTVLWPLGRMFLFLVVPIGILKVFARSILPNVISDAAKLAGYITNGTGANLGPDEIFTIGKTKADAFLAAATAPMVQQLRSNGGFGFMDVHALVVDGLMTIVGDITYLLLLICFAIIAFEVLAAYLEVYFAVSIGAINLGFLGSEATAPMAMPYIRRVWSAILRLIVIFAFVILLGNFLNTWTMWAKSSDPELFMQVAGEILAVAIGSIYVTVRLGKLCDSISGGVAAFSGIGAIKSTYEGARKLAR